MLVSTGFSDTSPEYVQDLPRQHKSTVAEASVLCASTVTTVAYPQHVSLAGVTNMRKHELASCPITRVAQDAFYAARGVGYIPHSGKATAEWFIEAEQKELVAAALKSPPVCNSLKPRSVAVTVLTSDDCKYSVQLLDAIAHISSSRCGLTTSVACGLTDVNSELRASLVSEAARCCRMGFLAGADADEYLKAHQVAFEETGNSLPDVRKSGAVLVVTYAIRASGKDVYVHAAGSDLSESYSRSGSNVDLFASEIQRVIAETISGLGLAPQSQLFQPLPASTTSPFMDHTVAIHDEFFAMLRAQPEARRCTSVEGRESDQSLRSTNIYVRFVPKNLRCENPVVADACFHGVIMCYPDKLDQLREYLREARHADRNPLYGIAAPNDPRQESIGIHVMAIQAHSVALEDNVSSYGLLGSPGKRLHRDGNYIMRTYRQLFSLTNQIMEQHYLLPCTFQSCIPIRDEVARSYFEALDDCYGAFAKHFGAPEQAPKPSLTRPSTLEFASQTREEAAFARAIGLGFGSPSMRIGQLVGHLQSSGENADGCPDELVALLMSVLSSLGPQATIMQGFGMLKDVLERRDSKLEEAQQRVKSLEVEIHRESTSSPMDTTGSTSAKTVCDSREHPIAVGSFCDKIPPLSLPPEARNKIMAALGLVKGSGGVVIPLPIDVSGGSESVASKTTKLVAAALNLKDAPREVIEECKRAFASAGSDTTTRLRIEAVARPLVAIAQECSMYLATVGTPTDRNAHSTAHTLFFHICRDGGVRNVPLCDVLETTNLGMVVLNHMSDRDECYWFKMKTRSCN